MFRATLNKHWGTRFAPVLVHVYFNSKPADDLIIEAFAFEGHNVEGFREPAQSGRVWVTEVIPYV